MRVVLCALQSKCLVGCVWLECKVWCWFGGFLFGVSECEVVELGSVCVECVRGKVLCFTLCSQKFAKEKVCWCVVLCLFAVRA